MSFIKFIELCNHQHNLIFRLFTSLQNIPSYQFSVTLHSCPQTQENTNLLCVSILYPDLLFIDISHKWNHTISSHLHLASLIQPKVFQVHLCCSMSQQFIPLHCQIIFHDMDVPYLFIYSPVDGHLDCFYFLVIMNNAFTNIHI